MPRKRAIHYRPLRNLVSDYPESRSRIEARAWVACHPAVQAVLSSGKHFAVTCGNCTRTKVFREQVSKLTDTGEYYD